MKQGLRHELPNCVTHMLRSYIPSTDGIYKGYTTYASRIRTRARAVTIDDVKDENHHWRMFDGNWALFTNDGAFVRY